MKKLQTLLQKKFQHYIIFYLLKFYTSTTSPFHSPSNSYNCFFRSISFLRNSTKLDGDLQPILRSLGQFLLININFSKFSVCKWHRLNLISIPTKDLFLFFSNLRSNNIQNLLGRNPIIRNIVSCFCHHWRGNLISLTSNWYLLKTNNSIFTSSSVGSLVLTICSKTFKLQSYSKISWLTQFLFNLTKGCKCSWHFTNIGYKDFLSYSSTRTTPCSLPTNKDTIWRFLNLGFNIKKIILWAFLFSYFFKNERKESNTLITSLLMLKANKDNSFKIMESSSIMLSNEGMICSYYRFLITKDTMHDLCIFKINFCIIIDTKKF